MHAGGRRKGKGRSRILYWFRTPPGVRVGRAALDEEAIRLIEEYNPEVEFDWTRILKEQGAETRPVPQKERDYRAERLARRQARAGRKTESPGKAEWSEKAESEPAEKAESAELPESAELLESAAVWDERTIEDAGLDEPLPEIPSPLEAIEGMQAADLSADGVQPPRPSLARLGSEGLARLRARYAEVLARISERVPDRARQDELKAQAERLNPDSWVTDAEVTAGLEAYESVFEALRSAIGAPSRRRRRRRRRGGGPTAGAPTDGSGEPQVGEPEADHPAGEDPDENL